MRDENKRYNEYVREYNDTWAQYFIEIENKRGKEYSKEDRRYIYEEVIKLHPNAVIEDFYKKKDFLWSFILYGFIALVITLNVSSYYGKITSCLAFGIVGAFFIFLYDRGKEEERRELKEEIKKELSR